MVSLVNAALPPNAVPVDVSGSDQELDFPSVLLITVAGNIVVDTAGGEAGEELTFTVPAGYFLCPVNKVYKDGTTATGITALYTEPGRKG